ncbi:phosphotransferase [Paenibacillus guangzhouensis]|uniref:phosphotransferase n=1 Tax=Paenibacillus guangzhouensis TaxID=1473112 RepID=UPI00187B8486|nr:phosphotransferase [Paenibacillus guangzhouensis]
MIPDRFIACSEMLPWIHEVTEWMLLRKWSLSEVYRVRLSSGESRIVKWGGREMAGEAEIYRQLVHPLQIKAPQIYAVVECLEGGVMVMEDAGGCNLEQQPEPQHFLESARELARLRQSAAAHLEAVLSRETKERYFVPPDAFIRQLDDLLRSDAIRGNQVLYNVRARLPHDLRTLYQTVPLSIVHHDFHAKNLVIQDTGIMPIDWSIAYLSPHLGDLYCLIKEARNGTALTEEDIIAAFQDVADIPIQQLEWQVRMGGICWLIRTLHWLVHGGIETIPGSEAWVPDLLQDLEYLYDAHI